MHEVTTGITTRGECAALCDKLPGCEGLSIRLEPEVTCQLVQDLDIDNIVTDSAWESYWRNPTLDICD